MDAQDDALISHRVMLVHFDSYSIAPVFAKWADTLLLPTGLPPSAELTAAPDALAAVHDGGAVKAAVIERPGLNPAEVARACDFNHWVSTGTGPFRVHLLRFTTFEAPKAALESYGGVFRPISALPGVSTRKGAMSPARRGGSACHGPS